jgi:hypothetical protein
MSGRVGVSDVGFTAVLAPSTSAASSTASAPGRSRTRRETAGARLDSRAGLLIPSRPRRAVTRASRAARPGIPQGGFGPPVGPSMTKTVAIVQSNYIPWKGYFDLVNLVDEFILFDDVQYTRADWRNRNRIKTPHGLHWLTIPVAVKGKYHQAIKDTTIADPSWTAEHWRSLQAHYTKAPHFKTYADAIRGVYESLDEPSLSKVNRRFIEAINEILGITTTISWSMDYEVVDGKTRRLVELCRQAGATDYISGPAARAYIEPELFEAANIRLHYMEYSDYPEYPQLYPPFEHAVSVLDLIFCTGPDARRYMKSF